MIHYVDGEKRYNLAPNGLSVGDVIQSGPLADLSVGNALPLKLVPQGTTVHNVEMQPGRGAQYARSAGASAQVLSQEGTYILMRMPSNEVRRVNPECMVTIGSVGNADHQNIKLGKAGRNRHIGRRPQVRGSAMNPNDHPHGGGEGRSGIGMPGPKTPWGKPALGYRTRSRRKDSSMIQARRTRRRR